MLNRSSDNGDVRLPPLQKIDGEAKEPFVAVTPSGCVTAYQPVKLSAIPGEYIPVSVKCKADAGTCLLSSVIAKFIPNIEDIAAIYAVN